MRGVAWAVIIGGLAGCAFWFILFWLIRWGLAIAVLLRT